MQPGTSQQALEQRLLASVLNHDSNWQEQLGRLLALHRHALVARCQHYLRDREDAEDAAQEAQLRAFRAISSFRGDSSFRTWLFAIADRQCHSLAERRRRCRDKQQRLAVQDNPPAVHFSDPLADSELRRQVHHAISRLPEQSRELIALRYYRELSLADLSNTMGIGLSATKMRLYRALEQLDQHLAHPAGLAA